MIDSILVQKLIYITLFQLWWVAVWGISYLGVEILAKKSKKIELGIYLLMLVTIIIILLKNPNLIIHL